MSNMHNNFISIFADWFKACQWLYAAGVAIMAVALFILFIISCCSEKSYAKAMTAAGALMLIAGEYSTCSVHVCVLDC